MKNEKIHLNPFVYISETDIRFYLLILIGILTPSLWAFLFGIAYSSMVGITSFFSKLLILVTVFSFIPVLVYWKYTVSPKKIIKKLSLKEFNIKKFEEHYGYIIKLQREYLPKEEKPTLMYHYKLADSFTFGTKDQLYIGLSGGLITKFRKNTESFKTIFLHELAHIANKDVNKICLVNSTWQSLLLTLSIPVGILVLYMIIVDTLSVYLITSLVFDKIILFLLGGHARTELGYSLSEVSSGKGEVLVLGLLIYFTVTLLIIYVLRNQMIRLREFYADAKVLEWEESSEKIIRTLEENNQEKYSRFEILKKFHPNIQERIQALKNNLDLFTSSLWIAFSIGLFYYQIVMMLYLFKAFLFSDFSGVYETGFRTFVSIFIFPILMLAVSTNFHKMFLKDIFINKNILNTAILNIAKFSMAFGFGMMFIAIIEYIPYLFTGGPDTSFIGINVLIKIWIYNAFDISLVLVFLSVFAPILIRRSFSKKEAEKNFLIITVLSSFLYIINLFAIETNLFAIETTLGNISLQIIFSIIFSAITYNFIKDHKSFCPNCNSEILNSSEFKLNCPNCHVNLYPWAIYSFS